MIDTITQAFDTTIDHLPVKLYTLKNNNGVTIHITNHGARITHFIVPKNGRGIDVVLGFNSIDEYLNNDEFYYGVTVGPFANRIKDGKFELNEKTFHLEINNGGNSLHSGSKAFHNSVWEKISVGDNFLRLKTASLDGAGGFPGKLICEVEFKLNDENELSINYFATTDQDTVVNLTNHAYFNLNGEGSGSILNHEVQINANQFVPINESCTPLGCFTNVENTPFDFRTLKTIAQNLNFENEQIKIGNGFDHSFAFAETKTNHLVAIAKGDQTGITLEVYTDQPGMQFYTGNYLSKDVGKSGAVYAERTGFCFETQHHPDSPNHPNFPSTVLKAGETFTSETVFKVY